MKWLIMLLLAVAAFSGVGVASADEVTSIATGAESIQAE